MPELTGAPPTEPAASKWPKAIALYFTRGFPDVNTAVNLDNWRLKVRDAHTLLRSSGFNGDIIAVFRDPLGTWGNAKGGAAHSMRAPSFLNNSNEIDAHLNVLRSLHNEKPDVKVIIMTGIFGANLCDALTWCRYSHAPNVVGFAFDALGGGAWTDGYSLTLMLHSFALAKNGIRLFVEPSCRPSTDWFEVLAPCSIGKRHILDEKEYIDPKELESFIVIPNGEEHSSVEGYVTNWEEVMKLNIPSLVPTMPGSDVEKMLEFMAANAAGPILDTTLSELLKLEQIKQTTIGSVKMLPFAQVYTAFTKSGRSVQALFKMLATLKPEEWIAENNVVAWVASYAVKTTFVNTPVLAPK